MKGYPEVAVLRIGHRPGRDDRMTTHVGLTARALGADRFLLTEQAQSRRDSVEEITERFGGPFAVGTTDDPIETLESWDGAVVHLTMYGLPIQDVEGEVREGFQDGTPLLVVVGAEKVPFEVYERADWNVAVTNQPHSEVASLAVFLDRLFEGEELGQDWEGARRVVIPRERGKRVEDCVEDRGEDRDEDRGAENER